MVVVDASVLAAQKKRRFEERRARDFYRYYEAVMALSDRPQPKTDLHDPVATALHKPCSSPDKALTAFCQLAALRLGSRRSMLFFFDKDNAYVMAEATRTLSLINDQDHDLEDSLWLGHTILPRGFSVCEHTVDIPSGNAGSNQNTDTAGVIHIINDLKGNDTFCDRPYVTGGPRARFYAGVPITSPSGNKIGALCILDDKPRDGLSDKSISFLTDMATTIIFHLESTRARLDQTRGMGILSELGSLTDQASVRRAVNSDPLASSAAAANGTADTTTREHPKLQAISDIGLSGKFLDPISNTRHRNGRRVPNKEIMSSDDTKVNSVAQQISKLFQHAAEVLQRSAAMDGVVFCDASANRFAGVVKKANAHQRTASGVAPEPGIFATTVSDMSTDDAPYTFESPDVPCAILGAKIRNRETTPPELNQIPEKLLRRLLKRYPYGKVWALDAGFDLSSPDDTTGLDDDSSALAHGQQSSGTGAGNRSRRKATAESDVKCLQRIFPNAKSLAMTGIRDLSCSKWYAAAFIWTDSSTRVITGTADMKYVGAFCDVIMAEVNRIDARHAEQAKSTFISSISHELRSPLHGILGTVECLSDLHLDAEAVTLIDQIETCGRTLLDIINHLLDFSKINASPQTRSTINARTSARTSASDKSNIPHNAIVSTSLPACVDLARITEDVVDAAVHSCFRSIAGTTSSSPPVTVILDIDNRPGLDWICNIDPGAWTRVCLNIVNNALKYTNDGYVVISLKCVTSSRRPLHGKNGVIFRVADTGCGMSTQFLENNLFRAYAQEHEISDGIGLGLSLVAKIMKSFRGRVEVQSEKTVGTVVEAHLPLETSSQKPAETGIAMSAAMSNMTVGILASSAQSAQSLLPKGRMMLFESLRKTCQELGIRSETANFEAAPNHQVNIILEDDVSELERLSQRHLSNNVCGTKTCEIGSKPLIVLCYSFTSLRRLKESSLLAECERRGSVYLLTQPCGPRKLARALQACLATDGGSSSDSDTYQQMTTPVSSGDPQTPCDQAPASQGVRSSKLRQLPFKPSILVESQYTPAKTATTYSPGVMVSTSLPGGFPFPTGARSEIPLALISQMAPLHYGSIQAPQALAGAQPLSMLLVDDNRINLQILIAYAKKRKHSYVTSSNGAEAVNAYIKASETRLAAHARGTLAPNKAQIILMDINMPVMDGFEATSKIRAYESRQRNAWASVDPPMKPSTIIALTGLGSAEARKRGLACGMDLFLTKPVRLGELTTILEGMSRKSD